MTPPIPEAGLQHVLSAWSGQGQLLDALAAVQADDPIERLWTSRDIRRRANRILFAELLPTIERLPGSVRRWDDALPAESAVDRLVVAAPRGGFDVVRTRLRGWPPDGFVARTRRRVAEELLARTTAWTLDALLRVAGDALSVEPGLATTVDRELSAAAAALSRRPLADAARERPDRSALMAVRRAGPPWATVAALAEEIRRSSDVEQLARRMIEPDNQLRWRLFHLGVLGDVLLSMVAEGWALLSLGPLSATSAGPSFRASRDDRAPVDVWFEAAGIWHARRTRSPYVTATTGVPGAGSRPLGPDMLLVAAGRGLILECKYSASGAYVATGYEQAVAYAAELADVFAEDVEAAVVGPDGVVAIAGRASTVAGVVSVLPASNVRQLVKNWLP